MSADKYHNVAPGNYEAPDFESIRIEATLPWLGWETGSTEIQQ